MASEAQERRNEKARQFGFRNEYDMRQWMNQPENKGSIERGKQFVMNEDGTYDPLKAKEYWEKIGTYFYTDAGNKRRSIDVTGKMRHDAVAYLMEWDDQERDDAIEMMRDIYGDSGEESE